MHASFRSCKKVYALLDLNAFNVTLEILYSFFHIDETKLFKPMFDFDSLFPPLKSKYTFFIKGLHLDHVTDDDPYVELLLPYFHSKNNCIFIVRPFTGRSAALQKLFQSIASEAKVIVSDAHPLPERILQQNFLQELNQYEHILFDNVFRELPGYNGHISVFLDYTRLAEYTTLPVYTQIIPDWHTKALSSLSEKCPGSTLICTSPQKQSVHFVFGTSHKLKDKVLSSMGVNERTGVYWNEGMNCPTTEEYHCVCDLFQPLKYERIILMNIEVDKLDHVLNRVANVVMVYCAEDFKKLPRICAILDERGIEIPEHIRNIAQKSC